MTANAFVEDVRNAIESGMDAHISKPVQVDNMKATIRQVLDSRLKQSEELRNISGYRNNRRQLPCVKNPFVG